MKILPIRSNTKKWQLPLWSVFISPFVVLLVGTVSITRWLTWQTEQEVIHATASQLQGEIGDRLHEKLENYLEVPHIVNRVNSTAIELKQLNEFLQRQKISRTGKAFIKAHLEGQAALLLP